MVGLLDGDFLANDDVEIDMPARRVALYLEQAHCGRHIKPWDGPSYERPFGLVKGTEIDLSVLVDGKRVDIQLDSGAGHPVLSTDAGAAAGATRAAMAHDRKPTVVGVDGDPVPGRVHRFGDLTIGPEQFSPVDLVVGDSPRSLLGADFLCSHRVWISHSHEMLYIQRVRPDPALPPAGAPSPPARQGV